MSAKKAQPFVAERLVFPDEIEVDHAAVLAEIEAMDDEQLAARAVTLRQKLAECDASYAAAREQWRLTGVYVPLTSEQLEKSLRVRRELGTIEHHLARRSSKASLAEYGASPIDWPVEGEETDS